MRGKNNWDWGLRFVFFIFMVLLLQSNSGTVFNLITGNRIQQTKINKLVKLTAREWEKVKKFDLAVQKENGKLDVSVSTRNVLDEGIQSHRVSKTKATSFKFSASCNTHREPAVVIVVLTAPTARGKRLRQLARDTWFNLIPRSTPEESVIIRFFLALDNEGKVPEDLHEESAMFNDMAFVNTTESYRNLFRKVNLMFKWVSDFCTGHPFVFKTDDDSFLRVDLLLSRIQDLPKERLYYGSFLRRMPARKKNHTTKLLTNNPLPGNAQNLPEWPWYASGAGYMLSFDVARAIAYPPLPIWIQTAEDRGIGMQLFGFNITYMSDRGSIRPWGHCSADALLLHYQRDAGLLRRRYERARAGNNICGEGWKEDDLCYLVEQHETVRMKCARSQKISTIVFAGLGKHWVGTGYKGPCEEGPSALQNNPSCFYNETPSIKSIVEAKCLGKNSCELVNDLRKTSDSYLPIKDPCKGQFKRMLVAAKCR
eukprot:m.104884 g.104884  ORF g.104884 m.104884 type:complete len:482 (+) comp13862_c1_seq2:283-1728(+)